MMYECMFENVHWPAIITQIAAILSDQIIRSSFAY